MITTTKGASPNSIIKTFNPHIPTPIWEQINNSKQKYPNLTAPVIFPTYKTSSLFIPADLQVDGTIYGTIQSIPSDSRIKENVNTISLSLADMLLKLEPKEFNYTNDPVLHYGFIAQNVEENLPNLVDEIYMSKYDGKVKTVNYLEIIPLLVAKIQDLQQQIDALKK